MNHSLRFVNELDNEIHTNTIESSWKQLKLSIKRYKPKKHLDEHVSYFMFDSMVSKEDKFETFLRIISAAQKLDFY